jgi:hypothetical protein
LQAAARFNTCQATRQPDLDGSRGLGEQSDCWG